jgi:two-component sensor histidine kinase
MTTRPSNPSGSGLTFPFGGGEVGSLIRDHPWSETGLGPIASWPDFLKTAVHVVLHSPAPLMLLWGRQGHVLYNDAYAKIAGGRHPAILGVPITQSFPEITDFTTHVLAEGLSGRSLSYSDHHLVLSWNGISEDRWFDLHYWPVLNEQAQPAGVFAIVVDRTQKVHAERKHKSAETQQRMLRHELAHRTKNTLAIAQAIIGQLLRTVDRIEDVRDALGERLQALSDAQDLLTNENWSSIEMAKVVDAALSPCGPGRQRVRLSGPDVLLDAKQALAMTLAIHELCVNALSFGALSNTAGSIDITWAIAETDGVERLRFEWREQDGPLVHPPRRRGFGTRMAERMLAGYFEGQAAMRFEPTGLAFDLCAPLKKPGTDR